MTFWLGVFVLAVAGLLQGAAGFGLALFSVPCLIFLGFSLPQAIALASIATGVQLIVGVYALRDEIIWRETVFITVYRVLGLGIGIYCLTLISVAHESISKQVVGSVLLLLLVALAFFRPAPREHIARQNGIAAYILSGFLSGFTGMGGPPLVLWSMAHNWSSRRSRAFLFSVFIAFLPIQLSLHIAIFYQEIASVLGLALLSAPLVFVCSRIGVELGNKLSREVFRKNAFALLTLLAMWSIVEPFLW